MEQISLARGVPSPACLPVAELADCARAAIESDGAAVLGYGPGGGYPPLREWIGERHGVEPNRVVVTNGSLQGFQLVAGLLAPGGAVLVEAPTYDRSLAMLATLGAKILPVPLDEPRDPRSASFLYVIPTFQNPTGRTVSRTGRELLAEQAAEGLVIFEDDPYGLVRFEGEAVPTVFELADGQNVIYSSSFSKIVAPGARVGYLVLPEGLAAEVEARATGTYITPSLLAQATVFEFLRRGNLEPNLERVCRLLRERRDVMLSALDRYLPEATWTVPAGGYFLWLDLPAGALTAHVEADGVSFVPGRDFFVEAGGETAIRLAFSYETPAAIEEGIRRLASAVRAAVLLRRAAA